MNARTYPRKAWVLLPSLKPAEVELVKPAVSYGTDYGDESATGQWYALSAMHESKAAAIAAFLAGIEFIEGPEE